MGLGTLKCADGIFLNFLNNYISILIYFISSGDQMKDNHLPVKMRYKTSTLVDI